MTTPSRFGRPFGYSFGNATLVLIGINVLVYALVTFVVPWLGDYLALIPVAVLHGWLWQPLSYMFLHVDFRHLLFNMLGLFFFGTAVERELGTGEFLAFYLLTGVLAGLFSLAVYLATGASYVALLGASGAIFALLFAYAVLFPDSVLLVWGIVPVRAPLLVAGYAVIELASQLLSLGGNVAHLTHLAGFGFAYPYLRLRLGLRPIARLFPRLTDRRR